MHAISQFPPSCPYEIIVADNASFPADDQSKEEWQEKLAKWQQKLPLKPLFFAENEGYGRGNNRAVAAASGEYIAIINPDIEVTAGALDGLLSYLQENEKVGLVAPKLLSPDGTLQDSFRRFPSLPDLVIKRVALLRKVFSRRVQRFLMWNIDLTIPTAVDWVVGACMLIRREAWNQVQGFDPRYFLFLEDTDLCRKLWKAGWQVVFHPSYSVIHAEKRLSDTKSIFDFFRKKTVRSHTKSAFQYFWKWKRQKNPRTQ